MAIPPDPPPLPGSLLAAHGGTFESLLGEMRAIEADAAVFPRDAEAAGVVGVDTSRPLTTLLPPAAMGVYGRRPARLRVSDDDCSWNTALSTQHPLSATQCPKCSRTLLYSALASHLDLCGQPIALDEDAALLEAEMAASMAASGALDDEFTGILSVGMDSHAVDSSGSGTNGVKKRKRAAASVYAADANSSDDVGLGNAGPAGKRAHVSRNYSATTVSLGAAARSAGSTTPAQTTNRVSSAVTEGRASAASTSSLAGLPGYSDDAASAADYVVGSALAGMFGGSEEQCRTVNPAMLTSTPQSATALLTDVDMSLLMVGPAGLTGDAVPSADGHDYDGAGKKKLTSKKKGAGGGGGASKLKLGPVDLDRQCGVISDPTKPPCARSLTCKTHSMASKRGVLGRSRLFDDLLKEWQSAAQAQRAALQHAQQQQAGGAHGSEPAVISMTTARSGAITRDAARPAIDNSATAPAARRSEQATAGSARSRHGATPSIDLPFPEAPVDSDEEVEAVLAAIGRIAAIPRSLLPVIGADGVADPRRTWGFAARRRRCWKVRDVLLEALRGRSASVAVTGNALMRASRSSNISDRESW